MLTSSIELTSSFVAAGSGKDQRIILFPLSIDKASLAPGDKNGRKEVVDQNFHKTGYPELNATPGPRSLKGVTFLLTDRRTQPLIEMRRRI